MRTGPVQHRGGRFLGQGEKAMRMRFTLACGACPRVWLLLAVSCRSRGGDANRRRPPGADGNAGRDGHGLRAASERGRRSRQPWTMWATRPWMSWRASSETDWHTQGDTVELRASDGYVLRVAVDRLLTVDAYLVFGLSDGSPFTVDNLLQNQDRRAARALLPGLGHYREPGPDRGGPGHMDLSDHRGQPGLALGPGAAAGGPRTPAFTKAPRSPRPTA